VEILGLRLKIGVSKKTKKSIKPRKPEQITEKLNREKNWLNRLEFLKNQLVRFGFIILKLKKPIRTKPKPEKN